MDRNKAAVALDSLNKAKQYKECKNYGRAFAHYLVFLELTPSQRMEYETKFAHVLFKWCTMLAERKKIEDMYKCYLQGLHYYPLSVIILNNFGAQLLRLEQEIQAKKYLQIAHDLYKDFLPSEKNLSSALESLVPRWHFRMLNNLKRNEPYRKAITSAIDSWYNRVLDIGTGCGLLTLFAAQNPHTKTICSVEESQAICAIAKDVFQANNVNNVKLINANSTLLDRYNIPKANVLITEIFDTAVFGEHVLETLIHAHKNLLEKDFKIIPASANVYITGIECEAIHKKRQFVNYDLNHLKLNDLCIRALITEPYEAEHILDFNHTLVTSTKKFITVNFANLVQLENIFKDKSFIPVVELDCVEAGTVHAFVIWFDLVLGDETITTNPFHPENCNCWEQAIVYLDNPKQIEVGDAIKLQISCAYDKLEVDLLEQGVQNECFKVSSEAVAFLNDKDLIRSIEKITEHFDQEKLVILDYSPVPIFGLIMALKNAHVFTTAVEPDLLTRICEINDIDLDHITVVEEEELFKYFETNKIFDVVFYNPAMQNGTINENFYSNYKIISTSLKEDGVFLPMSVDLNLQVVESDYLHYSNKVDDKNLFNYKIAEFINDYMIYEQWNLESSFNPKTLAAALPKYRLVFDDIEPNMSKFKIKVSGSGKLNGILYWYNINYLDCVTYSTENSDYYNRACSVLKNDIVVEDNDLLEVCVKQHRGLLKITCDKSN